MRALAPPDVGLIKQLEERSRKDASGYRRKVGWLASAGGIALSFLELLPVAIPFVLALLIVRSPALQGAAIAAFLLYLWLIRPGRHGTDTLLKREETPALHEAIDALRAKLNVTQPMQLALDDEFNAGALEMPSLLSSMRARRTLYLGVPLLAALTREELLGVIAHELGHFSRKHGVMSQRVYRARAGWLAYTRDIDDRNSAFARGLAAFAHLYVPYFNSYSFVYGRQCEYEADTDAASAVGPAIMARALARSEVTGDMWAEGFDLELGRMQRDLAEVPGDLLERFIAYTRRPTQAEFDQYLASALARPSDWMDTHPCLSERIGALQQAAALPPASGPCAGEALLGARWEQAVREFNRKWAGRMAVNWSLEHARQHHLVSLTAPVADAAVLRAWPLEQRLARADLLASHTPDQAIEELHGVLRDHPGHPGASYALGSQILKREPALAVELLQKSAKEDHGFRVPAYDRLQSHCARNGDAEGAYNYARRREKAQEKRSEAVYLFAREIDLGQFIPSTLPPGSADLLREARAKDPCVVGGWLLSRDSKAPPPPLDRHGDSQVTAPWLGGHAVILTVDPDKMLAAELNEDAVAERYTLCLQTLGAPNTIAGARVLYSTEAFAPELQRALAALPEDCRF